MLACCYDEESNCEGVGEKGVSVELSSKTQKIIAMVCGVVLLGVLAVLALRQAPNLSFMGEQQPGASKSDTDTKDKTTTTPPDTDDKKTDKPTTGSDESYAYTAAAGDSYTALARAAIDTYATAHKLNLNNSQLLQAEVTLANNAGSPLLEIGQAVSIKQADIAAALGSGAATNDATSSSNDASKDTSAPYNYTAAAGDSYTTLARTAISDYASKNKLSLSAAQRIAAENSLVATTDASLLEIGQQVSFAAASLKSAVDGAAELSAAELAAWQPYVALAGL